MLNDTHANERCLNNINIKYIFLTFDDEKKSEASNFFLISLPGYSSQTKLRRQSVFHKVKKNTCQQVSHVFVSQTSKEYVHVCSKYQWLL